MLAKRAIKYLSTGAVFITLISVAVIGRFNNTPPVQDFSQMVVRSVEKQCDGLYVINFEGKRNNQDYTTYYAYLTYETAIANAMTAYEASKIPLHLYYRNLVWSDPENGYRSSSEKYKIIRFEAENQQ